MEKRKVVSDGAGQFQVGLAALEQSGSNDASEPSNCARETVELYPPGRRPDFLSGSFGKKVSFQDKDSLEISNITAFLCLCDPLKLQGDNKAKQESYRRIASSLFFDALEHRGDRSKIVELCFSLELFASSFPAGLFDQFIRRLQSKTEKTAL